MIGAEPPCRDPRVLHFVVPGGIEADRKRLHRLTRDAADHARDGRAVRAAAQVAADRFAGELVGHRCGERAQEFFLAFRKRQRDEIEARLPVALHADGLRGRDDPMRGVETRRRP
mgnify:CR=1 FL=1